MPDEEDPELYKNPEITLLEDIMAELLLQKAILNDIKTNTEPA